ncbi:hypothetical protein A8924_2867 [Saccharopolyspora erythraea NRRL 2338]|uniref:Uncharacterized protein n=2 Tax=Saccharopolyspora erythraea TaxID=1836 RepID=A4FCJ3_SACEN|nr:DUF2231 domain-containing protein [Saccharopolyspora erythraea]EQD87472.1 hypothetical protein N599_04355 [Saccharopolyspora erythraea D]PFG95532.1 hypothetical protein A8924_2867 [Saccharopolyspora erythraea NRRL 2338]QRK92156.1 hypothetical protein JQX30_12865 [Saccharopolyspora erythraea]CAM01768.1 hypothetical protein SACE_2471 [Saccharopolyspora erythraea NRRL 2338]
MRSPAEYAATTLLSAAKAQVVTPSASARGTPSGLGPATIGGLPAHPLIVHVPVVLIPLASLALVLSAIWPAARRKLSWFTPALALVALATVPLSTESGEWLSGQVRFTPLIEEHEELAEGLLIWITGLAAWALLVFGLDTWERRKSRELRSMLRRGVAVVAVVGALALSAGSVTQIYLVGESGASAVWTGTAAGR